MNQPAIEKDNALTRFMREVSQVNAEAGLPAGRSAGGPANVEPPTRVRSHAMSRPTPVKPLSLEEKMELDAKAKALGIMPSDELDELRETDGDDDDRAAEAARDAVPSGPAIPVPGSIRNPRRPAPGVSGILRAVEEGKVQGPIMSRPQLPDFKKVQVFDLTSNTIYVDGMAFPIPSEDVLAMKSYAVQIVLDHVVAQLAKALIEFGVPQAAAMDAADKLRETINDGRKENVQEVSAGSSADAVPAKQGQEERLGVPTVPPAGDEGLREVGEGTGENPPQ